MCEVILIQAFVSCRLNYCNSLLYGVSDVLMRKLQYADDTQLYLSVLSDDASASVEHLDACLVDVKAWLKASRLRLNPTKTQIMWLGSGQHLTKVDTDEASLLASRVQVLDAA